MPGARRITKTVDVSIPVDRLEAALARDINSLASLEHRLRQHKQEECLAQTVEGIEAYNLDVAEHGGFGDTLRNF